jgi:tetratricopeptide (TPR) repeat protein
VRYYQATLALRPRTVAVHHNLGNVLNNQGECEKAIKEYRTAITLDPEKE